MFFDTFEQVKKMNEAGFSQKQSEAVVGTMGDLVKEKFVTKQDLSEVLMGERIETSKEFADIRTEFAKLRGEMNTGFAIIKGEFEKFDLKLKNQKMTLIITIGSLVLAGPEIRKAISMAFNYVF